MKKLIYSLFVAVILVSSCQKEKRLITLKAYQFNVDEMFEKTKEMAEGRAASLFSVFDSALTAEERDAMKFILAYAPLSDLADCDGSYFLKEVRATLQAREEMPWGKDIPEEVFLHFVLPLRVNNENLDTFRSAVYEELKFRVKDMNIHDAALEINHWCHEKMTYKGSDERTSSPLASMKTSWGRCGEESTFAVSALRAVGIPARQVYTPRWAHTDDNHAWVEVWIDGKWFFMGACEPDPRLNMGWFADPAKRTMLVHTRVYGYYMGRERVIDREERFSELNLISNYAPCKTFVVKVTDSLGEPVSKARVEYRLYNYAEFFPIARSFTGTDGRTSATTGLGDLLVWATDGKAAAYQKISVGTTESVTLVVKKHIQTDSIENLNIVPPPRPEASVADTTGQENNKKRLAREDSIRKKYMSSFRDSLWIAGFASRMKLNNDSCQTIIKKSQGNWKEITEFLHNTNENKRFFALQLLFTLTDKDLRDIPESTLRSHFKNIPDHYYRTLPGSEAQLFLPYVASPRIGNEMIRPWRETLKKAFQPGFRHTASGMGELIAWIKQNITINDEANRHSRAALSPGGLLQLRVSDIRSRNIFFVAVCRTLGVASRLNPVTSLPEYRMNGKWQAVSWDEKKETATKTGYVHFIPGNPNIDGRYMNHFTVSGVKNGNLKLYEFTEGMKLSEFPDRVELDTGLYLLVTGNRLADGGVLSTMVYFTITTGQTSDIIVMIREPEMNFRELPAVSLDQFNFLSTDREKTIKANSIINNEACVLIWIEPGQEPSRHVMVDIPLFNEDFKKWEGKLIFLLRDQPGLQMPDQQTRDALPAASFFMVDEKNALLTYLEEKTKTLYKNNLPVIIYRESSGKTFLVSEGYSIGTGEMISKLIVKSE